MTNVDELIQAVERARAALIRSVVDLTEAQGAFKPDDQKWSAGDVLEHLYLAELSGISRMWTAVEAIRAGRGWAAALPHRGKSIDEIVATTWKPQEVAPPNATPSIGGPVQFWLSATRSLQPVLADLGNELKTVNLEDVVFPHYLSGPLDGRQRLEFLRFHIDRHAAQVIRIRTHSGFPVL